MAAGYLKLKNMHSEFETFTSFSLPQLLHESVPLLRYTCITWPVITETECLLRGTDWVFK